MVVVLLACLFCFVLLSVLAYTGLLDWLWPIEQPDSHRWTSMRSHDPVAGVEVTHARCVTPEHTGPCRQWVETGRVRDPRPDGIS